MNQHESSQGDFDHGPEASAGDADGRARLQRLLGADFWLHWVIGRGGMATVWLAEEVATGAQVAIKALRPEFSNAPEFLSRFRNEAAAAEALTSDNVVRTFDYREVPDASGTIFCFIVMEYVRGESLADLLAREGALNEDVALDVLEQAAHGLAVIHRRGLVHRDIKPGNLMVTEDGVTKIADFGIAKAAEAVPLTRTGMVVGTAQYMSPEQAQSKEVTAASDVYSLGVVAYEMLSGRRPFSGDSSVSVVLAHINNPVPALPNFVSPATAELVKIALNKMPAARYADGDELALAVAAVRRGERPPLPKSGAVAGQASEPSPTAATESLAAVTHPTTLRPAASASHTPTTRRPAQPQRRAASVPPAAHRPVRPQETQKSSGGSFVTGLVIAAVLALIAAGAIWWTSTTDFFDGTLNATTQQQTVVTETVTDSAEPETEQAPQPAHSYERPSQPEPEEHPFPETTPPQPSRSPQTSGQRPTLELPTLPPASEMPLPTGLPTPGEDDGGLDGLLGQGGAAPRSHSDTAAGAARIEGRN